MESHFSSRFFANNRQNLRQLFTGTAPIVITANGMLQRGGDTTYMFSQEANFWYLTGIDEPDVTLVMDKGKEYLIVPSRSDSRETFDGAIPRQALADRSGVAEIYDDIEGWEKFKSRLKKVKHVATLANPPAYVEHYGFYSNPSRFALAERIKSYKPDIDLLDLTPHLIRLRMIKQDSELAAIQEAIDITNSTIKELAKPKKLEKYSHEFQIEAELTKGMRLKGASAHAFAPIVAGGKRACTLHNIANNGKFNKNDLVIIDTGAEVEHYAADITRTLSLGAPSKRQQLVHAAVVEVQKFAFDLLKPNVLMKEFEQQVENYMGEKLRELGLIKIITPEHVREFYPHATSHFLGLNVHDIGDYYKPLEPGVVITVEPGIYIKKEGIGVRIEDDVLITPSGIKILSNKLSRDLKLN